MSATTELPYVIEDIEPANLTKGEGGQLFKIKLSKDAFQVGAIISYDKYGGAELYVKERLDISAEGHTTYQVQLVQDERHKFLMSHFLTPGTYYFAKGSTNQQYGQG